MNKNQNAQKLIDYLYASPTAFQATQNATSMLLKNDFVQLFEHDTWHLQKGKKYFITKNDSSFVAFVLGTDNIEASGIKAIAAHTDSPAFAIKPNPEIIKDKHIKLNTAPYGGVIMYTWFDRPLAIAGRVMLHSDDIYKPASHLININKPLLIIPSLAIHLNRDVNKGYELNPQIDTLPFAALVNAELEKNDYLYSMLTDELDCKKEDILDFELKLYEYEKGCLVGNEQEFISSSRLDDLWMVYAGLDAILNAKPQPFTQMLYCPDNEEIGSLTPQGAQSTFLSHIIRRITPSFEAYHKALSNSYFISADLGHATNPNYPKKDDITTKTTLGEGPVLKYSPMQKYATNSYSAAIFKSLCQKAQVPMQSYITRSDVMGGSTIGSFIGVSLGANIVDMGMAVMGMHSIRELASVNDNEYVLKLFNTFYSQT